MPPPKNNKQIDESELPPIDRSIYKLRILHQNGLSQESVNEIKSKLVKTKRKDVILITRQAVLEFAEANQLFINPDTWDPKKKLPEGVPTTLTDELLMSLYTKYIKEQDLQGQRHQISVLEAEKAGKDRPVDPRFIEDPKKAVKKEPPKKKDPKGAVIEEPPEEKELEETILAKGCDYVYLLLDDFDTPAQLKHLQQYSNVVLTTVVLNGAVPQPSSKQGSEVQLHQNSSHDLAASKTLLQSQLRDSKVFVSDLRTRLNQFVEEGEGREPQETKSMDPRVFQSQIAYFESYIRSNLTHGRVWTWHSLEIQFQPTEIKGKDPQIHWAYYLKEAVFQRAFEDTTTYREYVAWLADLSLLKLSQEDPVVYTQVKKELEEQERVRKEKEAQLKQLEEEKNAKGKPGAKPAAGQAKVDPKKDAVFGGKKPGVVSAADPKKASETHVVSEATLLAQSAVDVREGKVPEQPKPKPPRVVSSDWRPLEIINKQLKGLPVEALSPGVFLEAFVDEIETKFQGGLQSQLPFSKQPHHGAGSAFHSLFTGTLLIMSGKDSAAKSIGTEVHKGSNRGQDLEQNSERLALKNFLDQTLGELMSNK